MKGWIKTADQEWSSAQYEQLGRDSASWGHQMLGNSVWGFNY